MQWPHQQDVLPRLRAGILRTLNVPNFEFDRTTNNLLEVAAGQEVSPRIMKDVVNPGDRLICAITALDKKKRASNERADPIGLNTKET